jgi:hypothetical protein
MKLLSLGLLLSMISFTAFAGRSLEETRDVDLVREVLRRGLTVDGAKLAKLSLGCKGSTLILSVTNESAAASTQEMVHMISGEKECMSNLQVLESKTGDFYETMSLNVCVGATLKTFVLESNLNIEKVSSRYVGVNQCLLLAQELNRHQD